MRYLLPLFLAACGGPTGERESTTCGLYLGGDFNRHDNTHPETGSLPMEDLQKLEDLTIATAAAHSSDPRLSDSEHFCKQLKGFIVYTLPIEDPLAQTYWGLTKCPMHELFVVRPWDGWAGEGRSPWMKSAIPHELLHVGQNCLYSFPNEDGELLPGRHPNWMRDGIYETIDLVDVEAQK